MIDLIQWRISIGCFCTTRGYHSKTKCTGRHNVRCSVLYCILAVLLLLQCGDVELNPGPGKHILYERVVLSQ